MLTPAWLHRTWGGGRKRPLESNAGARDRDRAAQKAPEGGDRQTQTRDPCIRPDDEARRAASSCNDSNK